MNPPSGGGWRGGKKSSSTSGSALPSSTPRGWKKGRSSRSTSRRKSKRPFAQISSVIAFLGVLLAIAIWVWWPDPPLNTHFVLINPLDETARYPYASKVLLPPDNGGSVTWLSSDRHSQTYSKSLKFAEQADSLLFDADVCVLFFRPLAIPAKGDEFRILNANSSPDLLRANEFEPLSTLRAELQSLPEKQLKLLAIDQSSTPSDWRTGHLNSPIEHFVREWVEEIPNLIIVFSCQAHQHSWPSGLPGWGGTHFECAFQEALTSAADTNSDNRLAFSEFYDYLQQRTHQLTVSTRSASGQTVHIVPPLEELKQSPNAGPRYLMKRLAPSPKPEPNVAKANQLVEQLAALTKRAQQFHDDPTKWINPILVATAWGQLQQAEAALLQGRLDFSEDLIALAARSFDEAESLGSRDSEAIGVVLHRPTEIANHPAVQQWLQAKRLQVAELPDRPEDSVDEVIAANLQDFPFEQVGLPRPEQQQLAQCLKVRRRFESAAALALLHPDAFRSILSELQETLLLAEDQLFVNKRFLQNENAPVDWSRLDADVERTANAVESFLQLNLDVRQLQNRLLVSLPGYLQWAATQTTTEYRPELLASIRDRKPALLPAGALPDDQLLFLTGNLVQVTREFLNTTTQKRLQKFETLEDLVSATKSWKAVYQETDTKFNQLQEAAERFHQSLPVDELSRRQVAVHSLFLPIFTDSDRQARLHAARWPWQTTDPLPLQDAPPAEPLDERIGFSKLQERLSWEAAWLILHHDLWGELTQSTGPSESAMVSDFRKLWTSIEAAQTSEELNRALFQLGDGVRGHWQQSVKLVTRAVTDPLSDVEEYRSRLVRADLVAPFLGADEFTLARHYRDLNESLVRLDQYEYGLLLADLSTQSHWVLPKSRSRRESDHWAMQSAAAWLSYSEKQLLADRNLQAIGDTLASRRETLPKLDDWRIELPAPQLRTFDAENNELPFAVTVTAQGPFPDRAVASMVLTGLPIGPSNVAGLEFVDNAVPLANPTQGAQVDATVLRRTIPSSDDCQEVTVTGQFFFRGATVDRPIATINPCPPGQRIRQQLAVRSNGMIRVQGNDNRPVVFVVDWSRSMFEDENRNPRIRYEAALNALVDNIKKFDPSRRVGIILFGHRKNENGENVQFQNAFRNFQDVDTNMNVDIISDVGQFHPIRLIETDREVILEKISILKSVPPWSVTPLGLATTQAVNQLRRSSQEGGIVVVITDGVPTDLGDPLRGLPVNHTQTQYNERRKLIAERTAELRRAVQTESIDVVVLAIDFGEEDLSTLDCILGKQDSGNCEGIPAGPPLNVPIIRTAGEGDPSGVELRNQIEKRLKSRPFRILLANGQEVARDAIGDSQQFLEPNRSYTIEFGEIRLENVTLAAGENILLDLNWSKRRFDVKRTLLSQNFSTAIPIPAAGTDYPTILRAARDRTIAEIRTRDDRNLFEEVGILVQFDHSAPERPVQMPQEVHFDITAGSDPTFQPDSIVQTYEPSLGSPAWKLKLSPWPVGSPVRLGAYWKMQRTPPDETVSLSTLAEADSPASSIRIGGAGRSIPAVRVWGRQSETAGETIVEVRIEAVDTSQVSQLNDLVVECGETNILKESQSFRPDNVTHQQTIVDNGVVVHRFVYSAAEAQLENKVLAITSRTSRQQDAFQLQRQLRITD